jgi:N-acetyl-anhydromuramyl-L-alanine amidase AmpD
MRRFRTLAAVLAGAALAACSDQPVSPRGEAPATPSATQLDAVFEAAGREFDVPSALLKSMGYVETRWQMVRGEQEFEGMPPAFGIMALRGERLERGARLAGVTAEAARSRPEANIRAAAALLSAYADELKLDRADLGAWAPAVARYSGIAAEQGQAAYVHEDVYATLNRGVPATLASGARATLLPVAVRPAFAVPAPRTAAGPNYAASVWRPSPWYSSRPAGSTGTVHMVVIHTCESGYSGCWSWLTSSSNTYQTSAHYVVNESGSEISQLVNEANRAHHIGATYDCTRNANHDCWLNGVQSNHFTVGIEHGGYASQTSFPVGQIDASAKLSCDISRDHAIPRDRQHFVGHGQLQPYDRTDPGPNWPWTDYLNRINSHCGSVSTGGLVIDSNNANNDQSKGYISVSANWTSTSSTAGYYGSGYYFANTAAVSDAASFYFYLAAPATKTIDAWWTSGTNRSATAPFIAYNAAGTEVGRASVNQQTGGGQWNTVGTWSFTAGWNRVAVSRWTTSGYVVIADAIRVR